MAGIADELVAPLVRLRYSFATLGFIAADGAAELSIRHNDRELAAERFELQVLGDGVNWKKSLQIGFEHQKLKITGERPGSKSRLHAARVRLVLDPLAVDRSGSSAADLAASSSKPAFRWSTNLKRTKRDDEGRFTATFDNPPRK